MMADGWLRPRQHSNILSVRATPQLFASFLYARYKTVRTLLRGAAPKLILKTSCPSSQTPKFIQHPVWSRIDALNDRAMKTEECTRSHQLAYRRTFCDVVGTE